MSNKAIQGLLNHMDTEVRIAHRKGRFEVSCHCEDGIITEARHASLDAAMRVAFGDFIDEQGLPAEEIEEIKKEMFG